MTPNKAQVSNILASRYASPEMTQIWSAENKVVLERELWIAVLEGQKDLGLEIEVAAIDAYRSAVHNVDLDSIQRTNYLA